MALRLTSGKSLTDPRLDGLRTVFGSAFSTFMKIRTEMNLTIWKYRLKYADPSALIKREENLEKRIADLHKLKAELATKGIEERAEIVNKFAGNAMEVWKTQYAGEIELKKARYGVDAEAQSLLQKWFSANIPRQQQAELSETFNGLQSQIEDYMAMKQRNREGESGLRSKITSEDLQEKSRAVARIYADGMERGADKASMMAGWISDEQFWVYARNLPVLQLQKMSEEAVERAKKQGKSPQYIAQIEADYADMAKAFAEQTNDARWPGQGRDIWAEHLRNKENWGLTIEKKHQILSAPSIPAPSGFTTAQLAKMAETVSTEPQEAAIQKTIDRLTGQLRRVGDLRAGVEAEREHLLSGGGMNIAIDPYSKRPSRQSSRLGAFGSMYEAEPHLTEAVGGRTGAMTFPPGEGGNLSDFLKAKIGEYRDGEAAEEDLPHFESIMDQVVKAVDLYGDALSGSDAAFSNPQDLAKVGTVKSVKELVEGYKAYSPGAKPFMAKSTLSALSKGDSAITRDYGGIERGAEPDSVRAREAAYNAALFPARTNISQVLNPHLERIMDAREEGDREGMIAGMEHLDDLVSDPSLDALLGSAGQNIRSVFDDVETSSPAIGGDAAIDRAAEHLEQQYLALAEQRTEQDPGAYGSVTNGTD